MRIRFGHWRAEELAQMVSKVTSPFSPDCHLFFCCSEAHRFRNADKKKNDMEAHGIFFSGLELGDTLRRKRISCFLLKKKQTNKKSKKKTHFTSGSEPERVYLTLHIFSDFTCERNSRLLLLFFYSPSEIARNYRNK